MERYNATHRPRSLLEEHQAHLAAMNAGKPGKAGSNSGRPPPSWDRERDLAARPALDVNDGLEQIKKAGLKFVPATYD
jgi:hypothetical protein